MSPKQLNLCAIFCFSGVLGLYVYEGKYALALWYFFLISWLFYVQCWSYCREKKECNKDEKFPGL
jgi:uncharacterized membrane protein